MKTKTTPVLLSTAAHDLGLVPSKSATARAQEAANQAGTAVTIRNPVTDEVIATVEPAA